MSLESLDILRWPPVVGVANDLRGVDVLESVQGRRQFLVVAGDFLERAGPGVEDLDSLSRMGLVARNNPHQGILISSVGVLGKLGIVETLSRSSYHLLKRSAHPPVGLRLPMRSELLKPACPWLSPLLNHPLHAVQICPRVQDAGMLEGGLNGRGQRKPQEDGCRCHPRCSSHDGSPLPIRPHGTIPAAARPDNMP